MVCRCVCCRPCAKEGEDAKDAEENDPVTSSMTISYTLPDGTEFTAPEPCVVARGSGPVPVAWKSPEHAMNVDESLLRALAECPRLAVKFTRDGHVDAETGEKGEDHVHVVELELAHVVLGSSRDVVATVAVAAESPAPAAFEGFTTATLVLRVGGDDAFTPAGLAKKLTPFALTLGAAARLPDAPATADTVDAACDPVTAHFRWATLRAVSQTASSTSPWGPPAGYPPMRWRTCEFGKAELMFGADMRGGLDLYRACATLPLEVHVHDRSVQEEPEEIPGVGATEGEEGGGGAGVAGVGAAAAGAGGKDGAGEDGDGDGDEGEKEPEVPPADVYGVAKFDLRGMCRDLTLTRLALESHLTPATTIPSGGDLDWKSRPGRYMDAGSTVSLSIETTAPLAPPDDVPRPYIRAIFTTAYANHRLFREILQIVRETNAAALGLEGSPKHVLTTLATYRFTPEQIVDPSLKILTGYHLIDGDMRQLAVEGTADVMERVVGVGRRAVGKEGNRVLMNTELTYVSRVYATLGADLWPIKLSAPLTAIVADAKTQSGTRVRPECREAIRRLHALNEHAWLRQAEDLRLFPSDQMLVFVDKKFGAELTVTDLTGKKPRQRGMHRVSSSADSSMLSTDITGEESNDVARHGDFGGRGGDNADRVKLKADLDDQNPEYLEQLAQRRRLRLRRDVASEEYAYIQELEETVGAEKRAAWQAWNVTRITREQAAEVAAREAEAAELEAARAAEEAAEEAAGRGGKPLHTSAFMYPVVRTPAELALHPLRPSDSRIEELATPWVENELHPDPLKRPADPAAGTDRPSFVTQSKVPVVFERDPEYFTSVHLEGDAAAREAAAAEAAEWRSKVVVDDLRVATLLPQREKPGQIDRYRSLLHTSPKKLGVTGKCVKGSEAPRPVSMYLDEPPETGAMTFRDTDTMAFTAGPDVDFKRFVHTGKSIVHTGRGGALGQQ